MDAADVIVVRPAAWQSSLERWKAYRETQGYRIIELDSAATAQEIRTAIKKIASRATETPHSILLTTDCGVLADKQIAIPTCYHPSTALIKFGGDAEIASDSTYGDLNDDNLPDIAVGRIPADSAEQLARMLDRTIAFEQSQDASQWRRDIHVIAGVGGFGALADGAIEMTTRRFLADRIPGWADLTMTQASPRSLYCPDLGNLARRPFVA